MASRFARHSTASLAAKRQPNHAVGVQEECNRAGRAKESDPGEPSFMQSQAEVAVAVVELEIVGAPR